MLASGSNSVSLEGVELPESGVRGGFLAGDPLPYMERNLVSGLFHASASLGIAESADATALRGVAGRINGDARPRMQLADNAVDLAAARGALSRAAALIDAHRAANSVSDGTAAEPRRPFAAVSLEPPLVSFCPSRDSLTWSRMRRMGRFGVNVLGRHQERFAIRAAPVGANRFAGIDWEPGPRGTPLLTDALAAFECEIVAE